MARQARSVSRTVKAVQSCLTDDLRQRAYRGDPNPMRGHCAIASEAAYFLLGGKQAGWVPHTVRVNDEVHWFLRNKNTGDVVDPTASQFACPVEYGRGRGRGFPTPGRPQPPSRRAQKVIACAKRRLR